MLVNVICANSNTYLTDQLNLQNIVQIDPADWLRHEMIHAGSIGLLLVCLASVRGAAADEGNLVIGFFQRTTKLNGHLRPIHIGHAEVEKYDLIHLDARLTFHQLSSFLNNLKGINTSNRGITLELKSLQQALKNLYVH